jgi:hypothetical protein
MTPFEIWINCDDEWCPTEVLNCLWQPLEKLEELQAALRLRHPLLFLVVRAHRHQLPQHQRQQHRHPSLVEVQVWLSYRIMTKTQNKKTAAMMKVHAQLSRQTNHQRYHRHHRHRKQQQPQQQKVAHRKRLNLPDVG